MELEKFGLYHISIEYLKFLHNNDNEVRYSEQSNYSDKPHLGIIVGLGKYKYFIPLTSAKPKHLKWKNVGRTHYLIYEIIGAEEVHVNDIVKYADGTLFKIMSALKIHKMIPVTDGLFERIDFNKIEDESYRALLMKEFFFLQNVQDDILGKAFKIYDKHKKNR